MKSPAANKFFPYQEARAVKGYWMASRFLVLRRSIQMVFLAMFLAGPLTGFWISKGTLASSMTLGVLPLTDGFLLLQILATRHWPEMTALVGGLIVVMFYLVFGGRSFCAWVCPVNPVTDLAAWLRRRLGITYSLKLRPQTRFYLIGAVLLASALTGMLVWELVNPITAFHRALVFGLWFGTFGVLAIFIFDLLIAKHGWCGHLCPVGAFYALFGSVAFLRVSTPRRAACDDCMSCFAVCPEPQVITPALRGEKFELSPVILSGDCTLCGACVDSCPEYVFAFTHRFNHRSNMPSQKLFASAQVQSDLERSPR